MADGFTPAQRLHLDVYGYVVIERLFSPGEVAALRDTIYEIEAEFRSTGSLREGVSALWSTTHEAFRIDNLVHIDPCFYDYARHPRLMAMAEDAVGGEIRLEQTDAAVYRVVGGTPGGPGGYWFHRVQYLNFADTRGGLFHFPYVKALTNLSDLGPDDGGTAVIPGSHKMEGPDEVLIAAALSDPSLVHTVVAPAGSTLFFFESLLHSSGVNRSGKDRPLMVAGYTPTMFQAWGGYDPDPAFVATRPEEEQRFLTGSRRWAWSAHVTPLPPPDPPG